MTISAILSALLCLAAIWYSVHYNGARAARRSTLRRVRAARKG